MPDAAPCRPPSKASIVFLRTVCDNCTRARRRCVQTAGERCQRCKRQDAACVYSEKGRTGRKTGNLAVSTLTEISGPDDGADQGAEGVEETLNSETPFRNGPPLLPNVPGQQVLSLLFSNYVTRLYVAFPHAVRPLLFSELAVAGAVPDYGLFALLFWTARFDPTLASLMGPRARADLLQQLFNRTCVSLIPAIELALGGFDNMVGDESRLASVGLQYSTSWKNYTNMTTWTLLSMVCLLGVASSVRNPNDTAPGSTALSDFRSLIKLCVRIADAAKVGRSSLYRHSTVPISSDVLPQGVTMNEHWLLERGRRCWTALVIVDNMNASMTGTTTVIPRNKDIAWNISEAELQVTCQAEIATAPNDFNHGSGGIRRVQVGSKSQPTTAFGNAVFKFLKAPSMLLLSNLALEIEGYRRSSPMPCLPTPRFESLLSAVLDSLEGAPLDPSPVSLILSACDNDLSSEMGTGVGALVYSPLLVCTLVVLLCSPRDEFILGETTEDLAWLTSQAFVTANEYAIHATSFLEPLAAGIGATPQMGLPLFQYCVFRTGLIHYANLRHLSQLPADPDLIGLMALSARQVEVHATVLRKGQEMLAADEAGSKWWMMWKYVTGLE